MSKIKSLALSGVFALGAVVAVSMAGPSQAQVRGGPVMVAPSRGAITPMRGIVSVTPGRPTVVEGRPIRPGGDDGGNLQARLRNACFNEPNPPATICRRYFGDGAGATRPN